MSRRGSLLTLLGPDFTIAAVVGGTIGLGILRTPGEVAARTGTPMLLFVAWAIGGLYTLLGAIPFLELARFAPQAGGPFVYVRRAFGRYGGFLIGWCDWIQCAAVIAVLASVTGEIAARVMPGQARVVAGVVVLALTFLQWRGLRVSSNAEKIMSTAKVIGLLALIVGCFAYDGPPAESIAQAPITLHGIVVALQMVVATYAGWHGAIYFAEEQKDGGRSMPRAVIGGLAAVTVMYLLVNAAFLSALGMPRLMQSSFPATDVASLAFGNAGGIAVMLVMLVALLNVTHTLLLAATRVLFALGRDGLFTGRAATVNDRGTPTTALLITAGIALVLSTTATFSRVVGIASILTVIVYAACFAAALRLRATRHPIITAIVLLGSIAFLAGAAAADTSSALGAAALGLISLPAYWITTARLRNRESV
jgi:APA family basic amino acid/polyamine antiporter